MEYWDYLGTGLFPTYNPDSNLGARLESYSSLKSWG